MATAGDKDVAARTKPRRRERVADFPGRERKVVASALVFLLSFGEELWKVEPQAPFVAAGTIGIIGTVDFAATVEERHAG